MKKLQMIALTMLFALVGVELSIDAADGCAKGWKKNKNHVCVKVSTKKIASNKAKKTITMKFKIEQQALNAMNAYNAAIKNLSQQSTAAQKAAITAINNVIAMYNNYLLAVQKGVAVVFGENLSSAPSMSGAANTGSSQFAAPQLPTGSNVNSTAYVSSCDDGSTATCYDGSQIDGIDCGDGTKSDINGMCSDGSFVTCADGVSQPLCDDYTSPM